MGRQCHLWVREQRDDKAYQKSQEDQDVVTGTKENFSPLLKQVKKAAGDIAGAL